MTLKSTLGTVAAAALIAFTVPAFAKEATVKELTVTAESTDAQDPNAARYYPEIAGDLTAAIFERISLDDDPGGYVVKVSLASLSLDGDTALPDSGEFNRMEGVVAISSPLTDSPSYSYPVQIVAATADAAIPDGYVAINPSSGDFYNAMVQGFAEVVQQKLPEAMQAAGSK